MILAAIPGLVRVAVPSAPGIPRDWYRAVSSAHAAQPFATAHSVGRRNRFNPGPLAAPPFALLHLAEDVATALMEVRALFGSAASPAGWITNPKVSHAVFRVQVSLSAVVDLTHAGNQAALATTAQELTGDWEGYRLRGLVGSTVSTPVGKAPTQELGEALERHSMSGPSPAVEGWLTCSARMPNRRVLVIRDPAGLPATALHSASQVWPEQPAP